VAQGETKFCVTCGCVIEWCKKWAKSWEDVRCCGAQCRASEPCADDQELEGAILLELIRARRGKDVDPLGACGRTPDNAGCERALRAPRRVVQPRDP
jgi:hypothetical protein